MKADSKGLTKNDNPKVIIIRDSQKYLRQTEETVKASGCSGNRKGLHVSRLTWTCCSSEWHCDWREGDAESQLQSPSNSWSGALSAYLCRQPRCIGSKRVSMPQISHHPESILQNNCQFCSLLIFAEMCLPENKCLLWLRVEYFFSANATASSGTVVGQSWRSLKRQHR